MNREHHETSNQLPVKSRDTALSIVEDDPLSPRDGGKRAWLFLVGAAVIEIVAWGAFVS